MLLWIDSFLTLSPSRIRWWKRINTFIKANLTDVAKTLGKFLLFQNKKYSMSKNNKEMITPAS